MHNILVSNQNGYNESITIKTLSIIWTLGVKKNYSLTWCLIENDRIEGNLLIRLFLTLVTPGISSES